MKQSTKFLMMCVIVVMGMGSSIFFYSRVFGKKEPSYRFNELKPVITDVNGKEIKDSILKRGANLNLALNASFDLYTQKGAPLATRTFEFAGKLHMDSIVSIKIFEKDSSAEREVTNEFRHIYTDSKSGSPTEVSLSIDEWRKRFNSHPDSRGFNAGWVRFAIKPNSTGCWKYITEVSLSNGKKLSGETRQLCIQE